MGVKSHVLRQIYRANRYTLPPPHHTQYYVCARVYTVMYFDSHNLLLPFSKAGRNVDESEIDRRVQEAIEMEDPDT